MDEFLYMCTVNNVNGEQSSDNLDVAVHEYAVSDRSFQSEESSSRRPVSGDIKDVTNLALLHHDDFSDKDQVHCLKMVDLNFDASSEIDQQCSSRQHIFSVEEEGDGEMMENKKELSEAGRLLQVQLDREDERNEWNWCSYPQVTKPIRSTLTEVVLNDKREEHRIPVFVFDRFFRINIRNPKISSTTFESYVQGFKRILVRDLKPSCAISNEGFVTMGVIVSREIRKSANGADYVMWGLHDLRNCHDQYVRVLLFGDACKEHWKTQIGGCTALVSPQILDDKLGVDKKFNSKSTAVTLRVFKRTQVIEIGVANDFGMCKGVKLDGQKCNKFVNTSLSEFCIRHAMNEVRKLSAKRGVFSSASSQPPTRKSSSMFLNIQRKAKCVTLPTSNRTPNFDSAVKPATSNIKVEKKATTKLVEKDILDEIINGRAHTPGSRHMLAAVKSKARDIPGTSKVPECRSSMADFIRKQETASRVPRLGYGVREGQEVSLGAKNAIAAKLNTFTGKTREDSNKIVASERAAVVLNKEKAESFKRKSVKRRFESQTGCEPIVKRFNLCSKDSVIDLDGLLERKSVQSAEADKAYGVAALKHLDLLEQQEKIETFVTECVSVKNVKVVSCEKCNYTSQKQSELCKRAAHCVTFTTAEKRFFKCGKCHKRTIVFSKLPTKSCRHCAANNWVRVAMKDERDIKLENERLVVRGEERKFANC